MVKIGLKSIDMQVALLRTQDASKMQEQLTRQGQQFQETTAQQHLTEEVLKRQQTNRFENVTKRDVDSNDEKEKERKQNRSEENQKQNKQGQIKERVQHPYLGRQIDWSG